jgi:hypothetical protein
VKCCSCEKPVESLLQAVEIGWYPDFWDGAVNYQGPVCPECQTEHLFADEDGQLRLKPDHPLPPLATPKEAVRAGRREGNLEERFIVPPKFNLGQVVATPGALKAIEESGQTPAFFLDQHIQANWGEVCDEDKRLNDGALVDGSRLLSAYRTLRGTRIWIITEAVGDDGQRAATTILLPEEY